MRVVLLAMLASCGGELGNDDASVIDAAADVSASPHDATLEAGVPTDAAPEASPPYVVIDGGACDAPDGALWELETCCNGALCQGQCVLFFDASAPTCFCAGVAGGCPGGWACCYSEDGTHSLICAATCPEHGPPK